MFQPISHTREDSERRQDADDILREPQGSGPREAASNAVEGAGRSLPHQPSEGHHYHRYTGEMLDTLVDGLVNSIWQLAEKDARRSADLLERAIWKLQTEEETDRAKAKREARE